MPLFPEKNGVANYEKLKKLEREINLLEAELQDAERKINAFEAIIRHHLQPQISRLRELTELYKNHKKAKKEKRLDQKRRGKNFQSAKGIIKTHPKPAPGQADRNPGDGEEIKRLYKEAIVLVHPDKFYGSEATIAEQAHNFTVQLNGLYRSGDLEGLSRFHEHIIKGNAMSYQPRKTNYIPDPGAMAEYLKHKKKELLIALEGARGSAVFQVLITYKDPHNFIDELRQEFIRKIQQFEKRTRKAGPL